MGVAHAAGDPPVTIGTTERKLLDVDPFTSDLSQIGDIHAVTKDASGNDAELLIEVRTAAFDRYVSIPIEGLDLNKRGNATDFSTFMILRDIAGLPKLESKRGCTLHG